MTFAVLFPAVGALIVATATALLHRRLHPRFAVPLLTFATCSVGIAAAAALALPAFGFAASSAGVNGWADWCTRWYGHHQSVPPILGLLSVVLLLVIVVRGVTAHNRWRRDVRSEPASVGWLKVTPSESPSAYAVPGRPGRVVVSIGMLDRLTPQERRVLFAHERAHLTLSHHRYLWVAEVIATAIPPLRLLARQLRFATERWADEVAAISVGNRRLVARAILRAALAQAEGMAPQQPAPHRAGFLGTGTRERVEALLEREPPIASATALTVLGATGAMLPGLVTPIMQVHHLGAFAMHVCRL